MFETPRLRLTPDHFAYVKIAERCNHPCSFCIIPRMCGSHRSISQADIVQEARQLVADGVKELNLISQDSTYYGLDLRPGHRANISSPERFNAAASELPADIVRQLRAHGVKDINATLDKVWGVSRSTPAAKLAEIAKYKKLLEAKVNRPVDLPRGRALFQRTCGQCHKLYGECGEIGPDITGSHRNNLDYLLTNMLDPNAGIPNDDRTTILRTKDNRVLVGVIRRSEGQSVTIATPAEVVTVAKRDVAAIEPQDFSMMPEGLVLALKVDELRDLVAYLRGSRQVALPEKPGEEQ